MVKLTTMHSWPTPEIPVVAGTPIELQLYDTADQVVKPVETTGDSVGIYVCGITPYDSTHLGHAATYLTFDLINRQLRANGHDVTFVENITDVDDPLFERAARDGVSWRDLGTQQINLFRSDMEALSVIPPQHYVGAMESVDEVIAMVERLLANGSAYFVKDEESGYNDIYAYKNATPEFGYESNYSPEQMSEFFAERGGDPERPGKNDPLDPLIWRMARPDEPSWDAPFGAGRPGWHVECSAIATNRLGSHFAIQGGGSDLIFPHHEYSAAHAEAAYGTDRMAGHYVHTGMIALDGVKMSKSLGNLVFVSVLTRDGHSPSAIRLALFSQPYRADRSWSDALLSAAEDRLVQWNKAIRAVPDSAEDNARAQELVQSLREALARDLDTPAALQYVDEWAEEILAQNRSDSTEISPAGEVVAQALDGLLGIKTITVSEGD